MQVSLHKHIPRFQKDGMSLCIINNRKGRNVEWGQRPKVRTASITTHKYSEIPKRWNESMYNKKS